MIDGIPGWVVACTAVCGGILLLCLSLLGGGVFYVGGVIGEFEEADEGLERLECITGAPSDFHPDPTGAIPAERIEAFLSARSGFSDMTARLGLILRDLGPDAGIFHKIPAGFRLPRELARYVIRRNEALGSTGIGLGEYYYIYTLAYHSWLGKPLSDGPAFTLVSDDGYILEDVSEDLSADQVMEYRIRAGRRGLNRIMLAMLRNQLSALREEQGQAPSPWRDALTREISALEESDRRLPWEERLPAAIERSLSPFRERLEEAYSPACSAIEIGLARRS